jgi:hypothetical protein
MSVSTSPAPVVTPPLTPRVPARVWPLAGALAGVTGFVATVITDVRRAQVQVPAVDGYTQTVDFMDEMEPGILRVGYVFGLVTIVLLSVFTAWWSRRVEDVAPRAVAGRIATIGFLITIGGLALTYSWKGALANYLGPERGTYQEDGLFVYYMIADFGPYIPWLGVALAAAAMAWLSFENRIMSRGLGGVSAFFAVLVAGAVLVSGVPGLPALPMPIWLVVAGIWLAAGRSRLVTA